MANSPQTDRFTQRSKHVTIEALPYELLASMLGSPIVDRSRKAIQQPGLKKA